MILTLLDQGPLYPSQLMFINYSSDIPDFLSYLIHSVGEVSALTHLLSAYFRLPHLAVSAYFPISMSVLDSLTDKIFPDKFFKTYKLVDTDAKETEHDVSGPRCYF